MARAVAARQYGDQYQALVFWRYALDLLEEGSEINQIGYEYDEIKSFDDIVIYYKKNQIFRDTTINREYIQVKFHIKQNEQFTMDNLLDPSFIDAKKDSFLKKAVNAYEKDKMQYSKSMYTIYSTWTIQQTDVLNKLINNIDGTFDLKKLSRGKDGRSEMFKLRENLCTQLSIDENELLDVLRQIRIKSGQQKLEDLKEDLNRHLKLCGLKPWENGKNTFLYCDLIQSLSRREINLFDAKKLKEICESEELVGDKKKSNTIAIKSFTRQTEWLKGWTENICDLTCALDKRNPKAGYSWEDIFQILNQFVYEKMKNDSEYQIALETSLSVSFTIGRILNPKSGIKVIPIQKTLEGQCKWSREGELPQRENEFFIEQCTMNIDENDMAISIGITHDINGDVRAFIDNSELKIGFYENLLLESYGTDAIKNGNHAWKLAKKINSEIGKRNRNLKRGTLHIFIAGPNSVMFYLGMQSMLYGKVQLYEYDVTPTQEYGGSYYPTISFPQNGEF